MEYTKSKRYGVMQHVTPEATERLTAGGFLPGESLVQVFKTEREAQDCADRLNQLMRADERGEGVRYSVERADA